VVFCLPVPTAYLRKKSSKTSIQTSKQRRIRVDEDGRILNYVPGRNHPRYWGRAGQEEGRGNWGVLWWRRREYECVHGGAISNRK